eukprot:121784_1
MTALQSVDVVIIGAGPAGLCASDVLHKHGIDHIVCEAGHRLQERSQYESSRITHGVGGSGLYSDGKFSFYPSASHVWTLDGIWQSFDDVMGVLSTYGIDKDAIVTDTNPIEYKNALQLKLYPSLYLDFDARCKMIGDFELNLNQYIWTQTSVTKIMQMHTRYRIYLNHSNDAYIDTKYIIFGGGRYYPMHLLPNHCHLGQSVFRRFEFGVRIEMDADAAFWTSFDVNGRNCNDPKYKFRNENVEFRTFCCCKQGMVVKTNTFGMYTFSGRADCAPTARSNFGLNAIVCDENKQMELIQEEILNWWQTDNTFCETISIGNTNRKYIENVLTSKMGNETGQIVNTGLSDLIHHFPLLNGTQISLYGPTLEGVGRYPMLDASLAWKSNNTSHNRLFCIGDCTGMFRGIVASMTSGNYVARKIIQLISKKQARL